MTTALFLSRALCYYSIQTSGHPHGPRMLPQRPAALRKKLRVACMPCIQLKNPPAASCINTEWYRYNARTCRGACLLFDWAQMAWTCENNNLSKLWNSFVSGCIWLENQSQIRKLSLVERQPCAVAGLLTADSNIRFVYKHVTHVQLGTVIWVNCLGWARSPCNPLE